ncbi:MAG: hypothetical protein HOY78_28320 [Saccharothrix sp.]|nr:hypothetical protein [Saccharothrix sp.]
MFFRIRQAEWRWEAGPGYQLRQYQGGKPTGLVAVAAWNAPSAVRHVIDGPDVWLIHEPGGITVEERRSGPNAMRLHIPLRSLMAIDLAEEPGLPGMALVRMTLTAQLGSMGSFTVPLWFPERARPAVDNLIRSLQPTEHHVPPAPVPTPDRVSPRPEPPEPGLAPLAVERAPDDDDWVVFRSASADEVVTSRQGGRFR